MAHTLSKTFLTEVLKKLDEKYVGASKHWRRKCVGNNKNKYYPYGVTDCSILKSIVKKLQHVTNDQVIFAASKGDAYYVISRPIKHGGLQLNFGKTDYIVYSGCR